MADVARFERLVAGLKPAPAKVWKEVEALGPRPAGCADFEDVNRAQTRLRWAESVRKLEETEVTLETLRAESKRAKRTLKVVRGIGVPNVPDDPPTPRRRARIV